MEHVWNTSVWSSTDGVEMPRDLGTKSRSFLVFHKAFLISSNFWLSLKPVCLCITHTHTHFRHEIFTRHTNESS